MNDHVDLFGLLRGELTNAQAIDAGDHLDTCASCREELAEAAVGHSLLSRAGRTLGPASAPATPPASPPEPLAPPSRRARHTLLVAAAVLLAVAAGGVTWLRHDGSGSPGGRNAGIEAALSPVSVPAVGDGQVRMVEHDGQTEMSFAVHGLPRPPSGEFYYAWLLDPGTNKMLPLGQVEPGTGATFDLADGLVEAYSAVDVSLEADDGDPAHSATSVLRGTYEPDQITTAEGNHR